MFGCIRHIRRKSSPSKDRTPHSLAVVGLEKLLWRCCYDQQRCNSKGFL